MDGIRGKCKGLGRLSLDLRTMELRNCGGAGAAAPEKIGRSQIEHSAPNSIKSNSIIID